MDWRCATVDEALVLPSLHLRRATGDVGHRQVLRTRRGAYVCGVAIAQLFDEVGPVVSWKSWGAVTLSGH
jgi:hypothetical protein